MKASFKAVGRGLGLLLVFALCAGAALAQQTGASLRGQVSDEFGGVIVGATVTVTDSTGKSKTATSDADGNFSLAGLAPGKYSVRAIAPGFALYENGEIDVVAGRNELGKITLGVSLEREEVTVGELKPGTMILVSSTAGADPTRLTAIQLVSNIEPVVQMMAMMNTRRTGGGGTGPAPSAGGGGLSFGFGIGQP